MVSTPPQYPNDFRTLLGAYSHAPVARTIYAVNFQTIEKELDTNKYLIKNLTSFVLPNKNLQAVFTRINNLKDNWDCYGAVVPDISIVQAAELLLNTIPQHFVKNLTEDNIYPNPNGTITIEWANDKNDIVSLEIGKENSTFFVQCDGEIIYTNNNVYLQDTKVPSDLLFHIKEIL